MTARTLFDDRVTYGRTDRAAVQMIGFAIADLADAVREHTAAMPPAPRDVGRCTESLTTILTLPDVDVRERAAAHGTPISCSLDEGHTGAHQNDETGTSWVLTSSTVQVPRDAVDALLDWSVEVGRMTDRDEINSARVHEKLQAFRMALADHGVETERPS